MFIFHKKESSIGTMVVHKRQVHTGMGLVRSNIDHSIVTRIEKAIYDFTFNMRIYIITPLLFKFIPSSQYLDFPDLALKLIGACEKVIAYPLDGYWMDLGRLDNYQQAIDDFSKMRTQFLPED